MSLKKDLRNRKAQATVEYIVVFIVFVLALAGFLSRVQSIFGSHFSDMTTAILR